MRRYLPKTINQWLLAAIPLALVAAWPTGYWTLGAAIALGALCALAARNPQQEFAECFSWLWNLLRKKAESGSTESATNYQPPPPLPPPRKRTSAADARTPVEKMIAQGRVALLLRPQIAPNLSGGELRAAQGALDEAMAIVPEGPVNIRARCYEALDEEAAARAEKLIHVEGLFLDRHTVSNQDYLEFLEDGGYEQMSLWDETIWPAVLGFTDRTGHPGPKYWENGTFPHGQEDHPVVGISWYEACAFARWAGKRLPTDAEWIKAATWPVFTDNSKPVQRRFPWGESMDRRRANIWGTGYGATVPVHHLPDGASVNGVLQLIGNVWEWTSTSFGAWDPQKEKIETAMPLKSLRGGAFDTYFDSQAHSQFQSGAAPLERKHNIGFRCALGFCDVVHAAEGDEPEAEEQQTAEPQAAGDLSKADTEEVLA
jgi:iron(II)-dependent oxidoreductase